jgi:hypothetical protein
MEKDPETFNPSEDHFVTAPLTQTLPHEDNDRII